MHRPIPLPELITLLAAIIILFAIFRPRTRW